MSRRGSLNGSGDDLWWQLQMGGGLILIRISFQKKKKKGALMAFLLKMRGVCKKKMGKGRSGQTSS